MKLPRKPPEYLKLLQSMLVTRQLNIFGFNEADFSYHHWDKLYYLTPPEGLDRNEWWLAIKLQRTAQSIPTALLDTEGRPFTFYQTEKMSRALHDIDLRAGGSIGMPEPVTNEATKDYYYVNSLIQEAITSSQLEGAVVTREVAKEMLRSKRQPMDKGERMILNNYNTMQCLADWKDVDLTPELIMEIQSLMTEGTLDKPDASGRLRRADEVVDIVDTRDEEILHIPPPADQLEKRLNLLCEFANSKNSESESFIHPVMRAVIIHFWLAYDHPFVDGNGRTARALFYWSILRQGYWLFEFLSISEILVKAPVKYARSYLYTETDDNDMNYFIHYQVEVIQRSIENLHAYIEKKSHQVNEVRNSLRKLSIPLNHRQETIINKSSREPQSRYTVTGHQQSHKISYGTARTDLQELTKLGLLVAQKHGKTYYYYPAPDLQQKLSIL